eukprot:TRINITY_DN12624_c0_g1_i1.p1 TRINITY_DN12624_c0_g1~~TRINITY_DN12624_c0_g1_i1.p1  ORF type:complete len:102 (-),score=19.70 TRINITY_DN12624_c0_g1_i1:129-434(-)
MCIRDRWYQRRVHGGVTNIFRKMKKGSVLQTRFAKYLLWIGTGAFIAIPVYVHYWKRQSIRTMEDGVRNDLRRLQSRGRSLEEIPRNESGKSRYIGNKDEE